MVNKITPEKNEIKIKIDAEPNAERPLNFKYSAYIVNKIDIKIEKKPNIIPM